MLDKIIQLQLRIILVNPQFKITYSPAFISDVDKLIKQLIILRMTQYKVDYNGKVKMLPKNIPNFLVLISKIKSAFSLTNEQFQLFYSTNQNDQQICIQNDEDFTLMNEHQCKIKFIVKLSSQLSANSSVISNINSKSSSSSKPSTKNQLQMNRGKLNKKVEESKKQIYFKCKICQNKYTEGQRYRCLSCFDYDVCKNCYKDKRYQKNDHSKLDHEFALIQSKQKWDKINFKPIIRALLGKDEEYQEIEKSPPITHNDIILQNQNFKKEMNSWGDYYQQLLQKNLDKWIKQFQEKQKIIK